MGKSRWTALSENGFEAITVTVTVILIILFYLNNI